MSRNHGLYGKTRRAKAYAMERRIGREKARSGRLGEIELTRGTHQAQKPAGFLASDYRGHSD